MRRAPLRTPRLVFAAALAAVACVVAACDTSSADVTTDTVHRATVTEVVDVPASVTANAAATLTAPVDGTLTRVSVTPGASVAKGAVLAVISSPAATKRLADATKALRAAKRGAGGGFDGIDLSAAQSQVDSAAKEAFGSARAAAAQIPDPGVRATLLAQIAAAQSRYDEAASTARRVEDQVRDGVASLSDAVSALGAAQVAQAQAAYDLAKSTVDSLTVRAPIAGVVQIGGAASAASSGSLSQLLGAAGSLGGLGGASAAATTGNGAASQSVAGIDDILVPGDLVSAGTPIATIVDMSKLGLAGEVDETDVLAVSPGIGASVELDAAPGVRYDATVDSVDLLPTPSERGGVAYKIRLSLGAGHSADGSGPAPTPRPGMSAVAHLNVRTASDTVAVPAAAVFSGAGGDQVWLVSNGKAVRQTVRVGVQGEDLVQILTGLAEGQRVVVSGADKVTAGEAIP